MKVYSYIYSLRKLRNNQERTMISYAIFIYSGMFNKLLNVSTQAKKKYMCGSCFIPTKFRVGREIIRFC